MAVEARNRSFAVREILRLHRELQANTTEGIEEPIIYETSSRIGCQATQCGLAEWSKKVETKYNSSLESIQWSQAFSHEVVWNSPELETGRSILLVEIESPLLSHPPPVSFANFELDFLRTPSVEVSFPEGNLAECLAMREHPDEPQLSLSPRFQKEMLERPRLNIVEPPILIRCTRAEREWTLLTLENFPSDKRAPKSCLHELVKRDSSCFDVSMIPISVPEIISVRQLLERIQRSTSDISHLSLWEPYCEREETESRTSGADWKPRWIFRAPKPDALAHGIRRAAIPRVRLLDALEDDFRVTSAPEWHFDILEERLWELWNSEPTISLSAIPHAQNAVVWHQACIPRFEDVEECLDSITSERGTQAATELPESGSLIVSTDATDSCGRTTRYSLLLAELSAVVVVTATPEAREDILMDLRHELLRSPVVVIPVDELAEHCPVGQFSLLVDASCTVHDQLRSEAWTKEEVQLRKFVQRCSQQVKRTIMLSHQPSGNAHTLQAILQAFSITSFRIEGCSSSSIFRTGIDVDEAICRSIREIMSHSHRNSVLANANLVDFVLQEQVDAREAMKAAIGKDGNEIAVAFERWAVACVTNSLLVGGPAAGLSALESFRKKVKTPATEFWSNIESEIASLKQNVSAATRLRQILEEAAAGFFSTPKQLRVHVQAESTTARKIISEALADSDQVRVSEPEKPCDFAPDLSVFFNTEPTAGSIFTLAIDLVCYTSTSRAANVRLRESWLRRAKSLRGTSQELLVRFSQAPAVRWSRPLKVFINSKSIFSGQPHALFRMKQLCSLELIERELPAAETVIVDSSSAIMITTISAIHQRSFRLRCGSVECLEKFATVFLLVVEDGIQRMVTGIKAVTEFISEEKMGSKTSAGKLYWCVVSDPEELSHKISACIDQLAPRDRIQVRGSLRATSELFTRLLARVLGTQRLDFGLDCPRGVNLGEMRNFESVHESEDPQAAPSHLRASKSARGGESKGAELLACFSSGTPLIFACGVQRAEKASTGSR